MKIENSFQLKRRVNANFTARFSLVFAVLAMLFFSGLLQSAQNPSHVYGTNIRSLLERQKDFGDLTEANRNLDRILERIRSEIQPQSRFNKELALSALVTIGRILRDEENFEYSKNRLLIVELNKDEDSDKYLDCDDYSSIYLAAAEQIGLPLEPAYFPDHVFLRCELENGSAFYWESTMAEESSIDMYKQWPGVAFDDSFPILLNETQLEAIQLSDLGVAWFYRKDYKKATEYFQESLEADADLGTAYNNLGASLARQGKLRDALDYYQTAIEKNPNNSTAFLNSGVAFYKLGNLRRSIKFFEESLKINPGFNKASLYKYRVLLARGEPTKALKFLIELHSAQY